MNHRVTRGIFYLAILANSSPIVAAENPDKFLGPRDMRGLKSAIEGYVKHGDKIFQYGNWYGPGWWGGSNDAKQAGNQPPVDSLDAIAQKHDFGYLVAEQQGKIYGFAEEKRLKALADYMAVRDAKALPENPQEWSQPPTDLEKASRYRDRMVTGFAYEGPAYEGVAITGKGLDWVTSPIENWELDRSQQLNAADLEKQVARLQNNWTKQNLTADVDKTPDANTSEPDKTNTADSTPTPDPTDKPESDKTDSKPVTSPETTAQPEVKPEVKPEDTADKTPPPPVTPTTSPTSTEQQGTTSNTEAKTDSDEPKQADVKEMENDPDYIELNRLANEMMGLANQAMAQAKAGKIPSNSLVNRITSMQPRISALSKRLESKYGKKYLGKNKPDNKDNKDKEPQTTGDRGGTVYNKDGSKDVLHYETDPDGKEVAVWTTYSKDGRVINKRREK